MRKNTTHATKKISKRKKKTKKTTTFYCKSNKKNQPQKSKTTLRTRNLSSKSSSVSIASTSVFEENDEAESAEDDADIISFEHDTSALPDTIIVENKNKNDIENKNNSKSKPTLHTVIHDMYDIDNEGDDEEKQTGGISLVHYLYVKFKQIFPKDFM